MDIQSMHIAVQHGVDKINSFQADSLLPEEIDLELNKSIMRFVNLKYGKNNIYRQGFEESQKRIDDLRNLITFHEEYVYFKERRILKFGGKSSFSTNSSMLYVDKFLLPSDYLYHISSYCNAFKSTTCKNDIEFELRQERGERIILQFKLEELKVYGGSQGSNRPIGWVKDLRLNKGATLAPGHDEIYAENTSSIENIGISFSQPLWEASNTPFLNSLLGPVEQDSGLSFAQNEAQTPYILAIGGDECSACPALPQSASAAKFYWVTEYQTGSFYYDYSEIVKDEGHSHTGQIIDSILNSSADGVEMYYENYENNTYPETFTAVIDPNVFNYIVLQEDASAISQSLVDLGYSVNLSNSTIQEDTLGDGGTGASNFTTEGHTQYYITPKVNQSSYLYYEAVRSDAPISDANPIYHEEAGLTTTTTDGNATAAQIEEYSLKNGKVETINFPKTEEFILDSTLKREIHSNSPTPDILNEIYWSGVNSLGKKFAGISQPIKYIQHDDILALFKDPFNKPKASSILGMFDNTYINVYTLIEGTKKNPVSNTNMIDVLPYSIKLTYLRKPKVVSLASNDNCDLPQHAHEEIVAMTISSILEGISDPRYKTHMSELMKNE